MPEPLTISGTVEASYHQFFLLDGETYPEDVDSLPSQDHGLVTAATGILLINTGIHTGPVRLGGGGGRHPAKPPRPTPREDGLSGEDKTPTAPAGGGG
ncbi:hypothetical protein, partial [Saccharopolyspora sp. 7B]|uniref:hypothetical protein n=1 Tax=Saccharopolyspora sp. 7B TaxID=2877240 RepID=UPI001CD3C1A9